MLVTLVAAFTIVKGFISSQIVNDENKFTGEDLSDENKIEQKMKMNCYLFLQELIQQAKNKYKNRYTYVGFNE